MTSHTLPDTLLFDANPVATFVIDSQHVVTHFNAACAHLLNATASEVVGHKGLGHLFYGEERPVMADLIVDGAMEEILNDLYQNRYRRSLVIPDAYEAEGHFPILGNGGMWLFFTAAPLHDAQGNLIGAIETLQDITQRKVAESGLMVAQIEVESLVEQRTMELANVNKALQEDVARRQKAEHLLQEQNAQLQALNTKLASAQEHLVQSEKLASIGQLAAGVAHEINNPIGYIFSNFGTLEKYLQEVFEILHSYLEAETSIQDAGIKQALQQRKTDIDLEFLLEDIPMLMRESKEGIVRVRKIVQDLKDFSHVDTAQEWQYVNINQGIESTLNIVNNEVKYKADVVRELGELPDVECMASQINQVVMNLVVNAAHAIGPQRGVIKVRSFLQDSQVVLEVQDNGSGIPKEVLPRIFDPFFTTKPIGKGTGLGLSLSYGIVQKHHGRIDVDSDIGRGTTFRVTLPLQQPSVAGANQGTTS